MVCSASFAKADQQLALRCLGFSPGFMVELSGAEARFDYLGDGVFDLSPPLGATDGFARHDLISHGGPVPIYLERTGCHMLQTELPIRIEIAIASSAGPLTMAGCCVETAP